MFELKKVNSELYGHKKHFMDSIESDMNSHTDTIEVIKGICTSVKNYGEGRKILLTKYNQYVVNNCKSFLELHDKSGRINSHPRGYGKYYSQPRSHSKSQTELLNLKRKLDKVVIMGVILELMEKIMKIQSNKILKLAISQNKTNFYLWMEIQDGEFKQMKQIDALINEYNDRYHTDDIRFSAAIHEQFMDIAIPDNYAVIPIKS